MGMMLTVLYKINIYGWFVQISLIVHLYAYTQAHGVKGQEYIYAQGRSG